MGPLDVPEEDIPQKGLIKVYSWRGLKSRNGVRFVDKHVPISTDEALVEMQDVRVHYGDKEVLGSWEQEIEGQTKLGLSWTVRRGERWGVFGPNGICLTVHEGTGNKLTVTRIRKNDADIFDLLGSPSSLLFTYQGLWARSFTATGTAWYIYF